MGRLSGWIVFVALCAAPVGASAQEVGSAKEGLALARGTCASCHAVERGQTVSPNLIAPTFEEIAGTPGMTATALSVALQTPHRSMPNLILKPDEIDDISAYILSLKP
jgi:mono/diheme cytochrome c family protein